MFAQDSNLYKLIKLFLCMVIVMTTSVFCYLNASEVLFVLFSLSIGGGIIGLIIFFSPAMERYNAFKAECNEKLVNKLKKRGKK